MSNKRSVQCNADIRVSHDILQALGIHATLCHLGAKGMSAYMGCYFRHLNLVDAVILLKNVLKVLLPVESHHRHIVFIKI